MNKLHYYLTLIFLVFAGLSVSAQHIITEYSSGESNKNAKYKRHFNEKAYNKVLDENGKNIFLKKQSPTELQNTQRSTNLQDVTLTINLEFDEDEYSPPFSVIIYDEFSNMHSADWQGVNPMIIELPAGTYDMLTAFSKSGHTYYVIKEEVSVQEDATITFNPLEADNYISITTYDENGDILQPGTVNPTTGNPSMLLVDNLIYFTPLNVGIFGINYIRDIPFEPEQDPIWNFYINDISDRYAIIQSMIGSGYEQGYYFSKIETLMGVDASVALENNPENWVQHTENFQPSPLGGEGVFKGASTSSTYNETLLGGWTLFDPPLLDPENATVSIFVDKPISGDPVDLLVQPAIVDHQEILDPDWGEESFFIKGNPVTANSNGDILYSSGDLWFGSFKIPLLGNDYFYNEDLRIMVLPPHPKFTFEQVANPAIEHGNNVPITVTGFIVTPNESNTFKTFNKGRYGENRESDFFATDIEAKQNGSVVFSGSYWDFVDFEMPTSGEIEITMTNANTLIEGLEGTNITTITYNADEEDAPPTLQHLQFRNAEDQVTSIFEGTEDATVRIAAGDFIYTWIDDWMGGYYAFEDGNTVEMFYSINAEDDWQGLSLTEYPEYFQLPAFGNYYEGSLSGIENENDNVWYDLKVICTDATGNQQEQVISPAFKINNTLAVEDIFKTSFSIYPNPFTDQLNVIIPENVVGNYTFKVTDLTGRVIYAKNQSDKSFTWNGSGLSSGVYILSVEENRKVITRKIIKK